MSDRKDTGTPVFGYLLSVNAAIRRRGHSRARGLGSYHQRDQADRDLRGERHEQAWVIQAFPVGLEKSSEGVLLPVHCQMNTRQIWWQGIQPYI